jgi:hypothetical protein
MDEMDSMDSMDALNAGEVRGEADWAVSFGERLPGRLPNRVRG